MILESMRTCQFSIANYDEKKKKEKEETHDDSCGTIKLFDRCRLRLITTPIVTSLAIIVIYNAGSFVRAAHHSMQYVKVHHRRRDIEVKRTNYFSKQRD